MEDAPPVFRVLLPHERQVDRPATPKKPGTPKEKEIASLQKQSLKADESAPPKSVSPRAVSPKGKDKDIPLPQPISPKASHQASPKASPAAAPKVALEEADDGWEGADSPKTATKAKTTPALPEVESEDEEDAVFKQPPVPLDIERARALSHIAGHTDLTASRFANRLTRRASLLGKTQAVPSNLQTFSRQEYAPSTFKEEFDLLQKSYQWCDLTDPATIQAWKTFYAKMCVINELLVAESGSFGQIELNVQKLAPLFKDERFRNVLQRAMFLFGDLSNYAGNTDAMRVVSTLNNITRCWNDYQLFKNPEYTLLPIHPPSAIPLDPAIKDKLREITSGTLKKNPKPSSIKRVALDLRANGDVSYVNDWSKKDRADLYNIKHLEKEMAYFKKRGNLSLSTEQDAKKWQALYAKMRVFESTTSNYSLSELRETGLPVLLYNAIEFFQSLSTQDPNAIKIVETFESVLLKILSDHMLVPLSQKKAEYHRLAEIYDQKAEFIETAGGEYYHARAQLRRAFLEVEHASCMSAYAINPKPETRRQLARIESELIAFHIIDALDSIKTSDALLKNLLRFDDISSICAKTEATTTTIKTKKLHEIPKLKQEIAETEISMLLTLINSDIALDQLITANKEPRLQVLKANIDQDLPAAFPFKDATFYILGLYGLRESGKLKNDLALKNLLAFLKFRYRGDQASQQLINTFQAGHPRPHKLVSDVEDAVFVPHPNYLRFIQAGFKQQQDFQKICNKLDIRFPPEVASACISRIQRVPRWPLLYKEIASKDPRYDNAFAFVRQYPRWTNLVEQERGAA